MSDETNVETSAPETSIDETAQVSEESNKSVEVHSESSEGVQAETEEEFQEEVQQAIEDGATQEEVQDMIREYTLKVNGKEYTRKVDLSNDEELQKELQMALAGRQAMQKLAESEKAHKQDLEKWKENPKMGLKELGIDPVSFAANIIEEYLQESQKSPEEIEAERRAQEYQKIKEENERLKKEAEEKARQAEMAKVEKELENDILGALEGDPELPATPEVIAKVADNMLWAMQNGWEDVTAKDVLPTVKSELQNQFRSIAGSLKSNAALKALLGDDILNNLREERVQQAKQQVNTLSNIKQGAQPENKEEKPRKKLSLRDFMGQ